MKKEIKVAIAIAVVAVTAVAISSAAQSFGHMYDWARLNAEPHWRALLFPISVDWMMVAATVVLYVDHRLDRAPHKLAYFLLGAGVFVSVSANVLHDWQAIFAQKWISGWGPLALFGSFHLIMQFIRSLAGMATVVPDAAPVPAVSTIAVCVWRVPSQRVVPGPAKKTAAPKSKPSPKTPVDSGPDSGPEVDEVSMRKARHLDEKYRAENGGKPITRDALKAGLAPCGTTKATTLLAALKKEREVA